MPAFIKRHGAFDVVGPLSFFPIRYPVPILALAGVTAMRVGCRFTLRSALIATAVVAVLLGMAVGL